MLLESTGSVRNRRQADAGSFGAVGGEVSSSGWKRLLKVLDVRTVFSMIFANFKATTTLSWWVSTDTGSKCRSIVSGEYYC